MASILDADKLLYGVLRILGVRPQEQDQMVTEVSRMAKLMFLNHLVEKLDPEDQQFLQQSLSNKDPQQQIEFLSTYFSERSSSEDLQRQYVEIVASKVIPSYLEAMLRSATPQQREKIHQTLQSFIEG